MSTRAPAIGIQEHKIQAHKAQVFLVLLPLVLLCAEVQAAPDLFGGPQAGEEAPLFSLEDLNGREVRLEDFKKKKPVLLVTGSFSCPVYRSRAKALDRLHQRYGGRAAVFLLYTVEAHPVGSVSPYASQEWVTGENRKEGILVEQPESAEQRTALAVRCLRALGSDVPVLVDRMDNAVWEAYGGAPNAAVLIGVDGKVLFRQGWFEPMEMEEKLLGALQETAPQW